MISFSFWDMCDIPNDHYGNRVIGTGTCSVHGQVCIIRSPLNEHDCIWCWYLEMAAYGLG